MEKLMQISSNRFVSLLAIIQFTFCLVLSSSVKAEGAYGNFLENIKISAISGNVAEIQLDFANTLAKPSHFTIENPARLVWDFDNVTNELNFKNQNIGIGLAHSLTILETSKKTRLVLNLVKLTSHDVTQEGKRFIIRVGEKKKASNSVADVTTQEEDAPMAVVASVTTEPAPVVTNVAAAAAAKVANLTPTASAEKKTNAVKQMRTVQNVAPSKVAKVENIDFRRGEKGEGRIIIKLSDPSIPVDIRQEGQQVIASFLEAHLPRKLSQRYDVADFATPVKTMDVAQEGRDVRLIMTNVGDYEYIAYQVNNNFVIDLKALTAEEKAVRDAKPTHYAGERLSLNFQDIEVRSVLQLIADFTGLNIITTDTVDGNITLRLQNVPWDQALDIILKTKGLSKREDAGVILVAPAEEIAAREQVELEANLQVAQLAPLRTELIQVNYARAQEMADFISSEDNSLLSERGSVSVDVRTNTLLVQETSNKLGEIRRLVSTLDRPVRQVLIEARVVVANRDIKHDLGARFGLTNDGDDKNINFSGTLEGTAALESGTNPNALPLADRLNINLPLTTKAGSLGFTISKLPLGAMLDLELSALESEGNAEIISSPRLVTSNQREALIESGEEIPFRTTTSSNGVTEVTLTFKKAVLALQVTPQITPDDRVILELEVVQDTRGEETEFGPAIDTQKIQTEVLVDNGETIVLGGVYRHTVSNNVTGIPFLKNLPYLGALFRRTLELDEKQELLIFVTPKIVEEGINA